MKYLVTGANGQLGSEWVDYLSARGIPVEAFNSSEMDVTSLESVKHKIESVQPEIVVNCAAYTSVDEAEDQSEKAFAVNGTGVKNLITACEESGCKLVHYSTDYVFSGDRDDEVLYSDGYPEDAQKNPVNEYGRSKREGEKALEQSNIDFLLIRVSWLCGAHGNNFVKTMLKLSEKMEEVSVVEDQIGSPTFTFDVVDKSIELIDKECGGAYHISSKGKLSWADFAEEIFIQTKNNTRVNRISSDEYPTLAARPAFSLLSVHKIEKEGLEPLDWKSGLSVLLKKLNG